jgi:hypothetical protein
VRKKEWMNSKFIKKLLAGLRINMADETTDTDDSPKSMEKKLKKVIEKKKDPVTTVGEKYGDIIALLFFTLLVLSALIYSWISDLDISEKYKTYIIIAIIIIFIVVGCLTLVIIYRKYKRVIWIMSFITLVSVVFIFTFIPAFLLSDNNQVIVRKFGAILFLSLLPGWIYLQFIAVRGKTIMEEYVLNLHRLHLDVYGHLPKPPKHSHFYELWEEDGGDEEDNKNNIYLKKFEALYGKPIAREGVEKSTTFHFQAQNLFPVILTTILLSVGWTAILQPEIVLNLNIIQGAASISGKPILPLEALRFGFAGSYFFILMMLVRRFFQDDLKSSAFISAMTRIIIVSLLVTTVNIVWPSDWPVKYEYAFAFLIGIFPQLGLQAIMALIKWPLKISFPSLKTNHPLSDLDGLDIWYESRLLEEGIEDMQNLATANFVDVLLRTRVPVERLVDWVDQALFVHTRFKLGWD